MNLVVKKGLDKKYFENVISNINKRIKIPENVVFYIIEDKEDCGPISNNLSEELKKDFNNVCKRNVSFSYSHNEDNYIIIDIKNENYLLDDSVALEGLILHELMHSKFSHDFNKKINLDLKKVLFENINKLNIHKDDFEIIIRMMNYSKLLLKELYANELLVKKKFSDKLITYYLKQFSKKVNSAVLFKKGSKENILKFELSLLSVVWSLEKFKTNNFDILKNTIEKNYSIKLKETERSFNKLKKLYFKNFRNKDFNILFFEEVFNVINKRL
ncbi:hypothetical protein CL617_04435 [archaeon]|nr:hypothetical protein [archaeon]|tara:strand:- start:19225 stop:20040 length:816 start_codon:yes stop_codon:yes gene_type:complete